ncbi:MAG: YCII-related protein 2 [Xanthobacteraceae bacterium]|nr:YCII-related protein 2 [Xanthobacteraceae bacterium]
MARTPVKKTRTKKSSAKKALTKKAPAKRALFRKAALPVMRQSGALPVAAIAPAGMQQLLGGMINKKLYVAISKGHCTLELLQAHLPEHLAYMVLLEKQGLLFASGPLKGGAIGDGLTIYNTRTLAHARRLAEQDPFIRLGLRDVEIREWTLMEGAMSFTVNLSDRSISMPPAEIDPCIT